MPFNLRDTATSVQAAPVRAGRNRGSMLSRQPRRRCPRTPACCCSRMPGGAIHAVRGRWGGSPSSLCSHEFQWQIDQMSFSNEVTRTRAYQCAARRIMSSNRITSGPVSPTWPARRMENCSVRGGTWPDTVPLIAIGPCIRGRSGVGYCLLMKSEFSSEELPRPCKPRRAATHHAVRIRNARDDHFEPRRVP